jgi:hypothetical protein
VTSMLRPPLTHHTDQPTVLTTRRQTDIIERLLRVLLPLLTLGVTDLLRKGQHRPLTMVTLLHLYKPLPD